MRKTNKMSHKKKMAFRIMMHKLIFMNHILHLEEDSLAKQIQSAQQTYNVGGLTEEVKGFIAQLSIPNRILFQHKYSMTENVKMNYKGDQNYAKSLWKCQKCGNQDSEIHLLWCSGYADLRKDLDLGSNKDLCSYLQKIIQQRCKEK